MGLQKKKHVPTLSPPAPKKAIDKDKGAKAQFSVPKDAASFLKKRLEQKVGLGKQIAARRVQDLIGLQETAARRGGDFEQQCGEAEAADDLAAGQMNREKEADNTRKAYFKELHKVIVAADVVVEILDARDPAACRSAELEKDVIAQGKRLVLLLNKIDLVPKPAVEAWVKYLKRSFPVVPFKAARSGVSRPSHAHTSASSAPEGLLRSTHGVVGADELIQLLKNYARHVGGGKEKSAISVGIVGYPNTGKSSVINSLKRECAVNVGGRAGVTKEMQEVKLDSKVTLIDSPGVVFAGASDDPSVALKNVLRIEQVPDPVGVVEALVLKAPRDSLLKFYKMPRDFSSPHELIVHVAKARGKLKRGSGLDLPSSARSILSDWNNGKFRYYVLPPVSDDAMASAVAETADIVAAAAPALDIDALLRGEGDAPMVMGAAEVGASGGDVAMDGGEGGSLVKVDDACMA